MTASSADTAELPRVRRRAPIVRSDAPLLAPPRPPQLAPEPGDLVVPEDRAIGAVPDARSVEASPVEAPAAGRAALRAERLAARRVRRRWAVLGLSLMAGTLGATIVVLDVLH
jgi:hypothetical protein